MTIRILIKELQEIAKNELNEDPNRTADDLNHIHRWLTKQPHLNAKNDDQLLLTFLRNAKFSLEKAKEKIDQYYAMRSLAPEIYDRNPYSPEIQAILRDGIVLVNNSKSSLPGLMVVRWGKANLEKFSVQSILKIIVMLLDIMIHENDNITICGLHFLADLKDIPLGYLPQFTPSTNKKFIMSLQDVNPIRLKGINVINIPSVFQAIATLSKSFMKDKMKDRFNVYGENFNKLREHIPPSILPIEYGGEAPPLDDIKDKWKKKIESYYDWFVNDAQYGTDESKRPGKPKMASDIFGLEGSFRTLNID